MRNEYDLVVIGGGAAGFSAVTAASEREANVLLVSYGPLGGTCVNYGCVPTKAMLTKLSIYSKLGVKAHFKDLLGYARSLSAKLRADKYESVIKDLGIDYIEGFAKFISNSSIVVDGRRIKFKKAIIAVGGKAIIPNIPGIDGVLDRLLDNEKLFSSEIELGKVIVIGGRAQGIELSQIFARSGVEVVLLQRSGRLLPKDEPEAGLYLRKVLERDGVKVVTGTRLKKFERSDGVVRVWYEAGKEEFVEEADYVYMATGRKPVLDGMGLENAGVKVNEKGYIIVDRHLRAADNIYAAGDCINGYMLEPVAAKEGYVAARNALGDDVEIDYSVIPRAVFTDPEFASVGLTEEELARRIGACSCRTVELSTIPKARILGYDEGFIKMVIDPNDRRIVGLHMVAPNASEAIHEAAFAIRAGFTIDDLIDTVHVFPTISEAIKYAALSFYLDVSKMPCCLI